MKKIITILCLLIVALFACPLYANDTKVIDEYGALDLDDIDYLNSQIHTMIDELGFDVVVYIANDSNGDITALADDYFDYNGYGLGSDREGIILCINYYYRDYTITTRGPKTIALFNDTTLNGIYDELTPYLANDETRQAVSTFLNDVSLVYSYPDFYNNDYSNDTQVNPQEAKLEDLKQAAMIGGISSLLVGVATFFILRGQLKTQKIQTQANQYVTGSRLNLSRSGEIYLYKTSHTVKVVNHDNEHHGGGGSSVHISSSGASHGGGGSHHF